MCGRYALHSNPEVIALQFGLASPPDFEVSYNIPPSSMVLVVRNSLESEPVAGNCRWGLIPEWAKDPAIGSKLANALMAAIHDRMPVIIEPGDYAAWLDVKNDAAKTFLRPYSDSGMETYPVSLRVNTPRNDDPELIERSDSRV